MGGLPRAAIENARALQDLIHAIKGIPFGPGRARSATRRRLPVPRPAGRSSRDDAEFFFGRDADVQRLLEKLKADRFLAVLGPSGSGKSSLVRAGLLPALPRGALPGGDELARLPCCGPGPAADRARRPRSADARAGCGAMQATLDGARRPTSARCTWRSSLALGGRPPRRVLLVVDQFEEVFTLCRDEAERRALFANLLYAATVAGGGPWSSC